MLMLTEQAGGAGKIVRADGDGVDTGHGQEFVDRIERRNVLDLRHHENRLIGDRDIVYDIGIIFGYAARAETASSLRRIATGAYQIAAFGDVTDHWRHNALNAHVKRLLDTNMIVPRHTDDRRRFRTIEAHERCLQRQEVPRAVFGVDEQEIEADAGEHLGGARVGEAEPGAEHRLAALQFGLQRAYASKRAPTAAGGL